MVGASEFEFALAIKKTAVKKSILGHCKNICS